MLSVLGAGVHAYLPGGGAFHPEQYLDCFLAFACGFSNSNWGQLQDF